MDNLFDSDVTVETASASPPPPPEWAAHGPATPATAGKADEGNDMKMPSQDEVVKASQLALNELQALLRKGDPTAERVVGRLIRDHAAGDFYAWPKELMTRGLVSLGVSRTAATKLVAEAFAVWLARRRPSRRRKAT